jgi:hypothetical protein
MELTERIKIEGLSLIIDLNDKTQYGENEIGLDETNRMVKELSELTSYEFNTYLQNLDPLNKVPLKKKELEIRTNKASILYESKKKATYSIDLEFRNSTEVSHTHGSICEEDYIRGIDIDVTIKSNVPATIDNFKNNQCPTLFYKVCHCIEKLRDYNL